MKVSYEFLEHVIDVPALRIQAFELSLRQGRELSDDAILAATLVYAHALKYAPAEIAMALVLRVFTHHQWNVNAVAVMNRSFLVSNGEVLWDIASCEQLDPSKLPGIYEQHGLDLDEYTTLVEETHRDVNARREQRRIAGAPRAAAGPPTSGVPGEPAACAPAPASA